MISTMREETRAPRLFCLRLGAHAEALQGLQHRLAFLQHAEHLPLDRLLPAQFLQLPLFRLYLLFLGPLLPALALPGELDLPLLEAVHPPVVQRVGVEIPHVHPVRGKFALLHLLAHVERRQLVPHASLLPSLRVVFVLGLVITRGLFSIVVVARPAPEFLPLDVAKTQELLGGPPFFLARSGRRSRLVVVVVLGGGEHVVIVVFFCRAIDGGSTAENYSLAIVARVGVVSLGFDAPFTRRRWVLESRVHLLREISRVVRRLEKSRLFCRRRP